MSLRAAAAAAVLTLVAGGSALVAVADAPDDRVPVTRVWEPPRYCPDPYAGVQVKRLRGDAPATLELVRAGVGVVDTEPLDVRGEVIFLRDPAPMGPGGYRTYAVRVITARADVEVARVFIDNRPC